MPDPRLNGAGLGFRRDLLPDLQAAQKSEIPLAIDFFELAPPSESERAILIDSLSVTPVAVDDVIKSTGIATGRVQTLLLELDLEGRIEWSSGQLVALRP